MTAITAPWSAAGGIYRDARMEEAGMPHGVTTRPLGDMKDPARREAALRERGLDGRRPRVLRQAHGARVWEVSSPQDAPRGDGWICADPAAVACVYVADCLPIFLWDRRGRAAVGVFHAGWRGLAAGMPRAAARAFRRYGIGPESLAASVGPHIGPCCYRVGPDVASKFPPEGLVRGSFLDLGLLARRQLEESGLESGAIAVSADCTSCRPEEFFSYRRDKMDRRMMAFAGLPDAGF